MAGVIKAKYFSSFQHSQHVSPFRQNVTHYLYTCSLSETSEVSRAQVEQCLNKTLLKDTSSVDSQDCFQVICNIDE